MSMILDAIKRSKEAPEGEGSIPSLETEHYVAPDKPIWSEVSPNFVALIAITLVVTCLALMYSSGHDGFDASHKDASEKQRDVVEEKVEVINNGGSETLSLSEDANDASSQSSLLSANPVLGSPKPKNRVMVSSGAMGNTRPIVVPTEIKSGTVNRPNADELSSLYAAMNEEAEATLVASTAAGAATGAALDLPDQAAEVSGTAEDSDESTAVDFAEILAQAQKELGVQPLVESGEPLLETLSQQTKDQIPSLIYSEHNYSANGRSEVVLNGQSLTDRQRVGPFTVVEILPDSVILRWRETQFRVRARNSWINM